VIQEKLGRAAVKYGTRYLRVRYRRELRVAAVAAVVLAALLVARAARHAPEG
jgi:hypothetical protein